MKKINENEFIKSKLKCKICGKLANEDDHFNKMGQLCNRHYTQWRKYGRFLDDKCVINPKRRTWSNEEVKIICDKYLSGEEEKNIALEYNCSIGSIDHVLKRGGINKEIRYTNDSRFKAAYQDYDWCYERYIIKGLSMQEMAKEACCELRTIQKWCNEKHKLNNRTRKKEIHLSQKQKELIMFSLLGDGHIDKRETQPLFIVSHAINQKDYLFWKYDMLKNLCNKPPVFHDKNIYSFGTNKEYLCNEYYRFETRIIDDLIPIRDMNKSEIISKLNGFGLSIHLLDDGSCSNNFWQLCYASFTSEERELYCNILKDKFNIEPHLHKDERYIGFSKKDSMIINDIILKNIPNHLDIIQYKILGKREVCA